MKQISVIGLGYVGLPTAATIAARGVRVHGVDIRPDVVERINSGNTHIIEPDLDIVVHSVVSTGMLKAATQPEPADAFIIAVPTPVRDDNTPDMRAVEGALAAIAPVLARRQPRHHRIDVARRHDAARGRPARRCGPTSPFPTRPESARTC